MCDNSVRNYALYYMKRNMKLLSEVGFSVLSIEFFNIFFSLEREVTEKIVNTLLGTDFIIDNIEVNEVDKNIFGFYHPYLVLDSHMEKGRVAIILTVMTEDRDDETTSLLNWMLYMTKMERREIYPLVLCLDTTGGFKEGEPQVTLRIINEWPLSFALSVVWMKMNTPEMGEKEALIRDLMCRDEDKIKNEDIRRLYAVTHEKSGVREMEDVAYSLWLDSLKMDIEKLGVDPSLLKPRQSKS